MEHRKICGIYFLKQGDEIVYVGKSVNVHKRVWAGHRDKVFDDYDIEECSREELRKREVCWIRKLEPLYNKNRYKEKKKKPRRPPSQLTTFRIPKQDREILENYFARAGHRSFSEGARLIFRQFIRDRGLI